MRQNKLLITVLTVFAIAACGKETVKSDRPAWIDDPGGNFVGKCATHVRGTIAQEQCAYKKGLAYIAMSKGVSVDISSQMTMKQTATEKTGKSFGQVQAVVKMDEKNINVSGNIIDKWHDKTADIFYVLIEEN